ncbi:MAG: Regulatory protein RecX, partial [Candidatus Daviesbacteria bacterium GW2011_GWB1_39_5]
IRAIKSELFQKGIDKEIIEKVISDTRYEISEEELAKQALEKKIKYWKNLDPKKLYQKSIEFLLRKGFDYEVVKSVIEKVIKKE